MTRNKGLLHSNPILHLVYYFVCIYYLFYFYKIFDDLLFKVSTAMFGSSLFVFTNSGWRRFAHLF